jgi:hypothetical protein
MSKVVDLKKSIHHAKAAAKGERGPPPVDENPYLDWVPDDCPVQPLGENGDYYFFMSRSGQIRQVKFKDVGQKFFDSLFGGDMTWVHKYFSTTVEGETKVNWRQFGLFMIRWCVRKGLFDPASERRGLGVWKSSSGSLIVHVGDALLIDGVEHPCGLVDKGVIYTACARGKRPADIAATAADGQSLRDMLGLWRFKEPEDLADDVAVGRVQSTGADLVLGYIGSAALGGAVPWRAHVQVGAEHGSGKSTLVEMVHAASGGGIGEPNNDFSAAGIRQTLTGEARGLLLDEAESEEGAHERIRQVIALLRTMSQGEGGHAVRGGADGIAKHYRVTGSVYLTAILPPPLKAQDKSRITPIQLWRLETGSHAVDKAEEVKRAIDRAKALGPGLRARAIAGYGRFIETWKAYRAAFMSAGKMPRNADQIATLLAGRDLLIADDVPDSDFLIEEVARFASYVADPDEAEADGEGPRCLDHLITSSIDSWANGERRNIGAQIVLARSSNASEFEAVEARKRLQRYGLRLVCPAITGKSVYDPDPTTHWLFVANGHQALSRIFDGSGWAKGGWAAALRYLRGAKPAEQYIENQKMRGTLVPFEFLPEPDGLDDGGNDGAGY